jgi:NhaA family Na+:H+ antiporter
VDPIAIGIMLALVVGKVVGVLGATVLVTSVSRARLDPDLEWIDVIGLSMLTGVGFTVSLLISELSFGQGSVSDDHAKVGILAGSLLAAVLATVILRVRNRHYRRIQADDAVDDDGDGVPDRFQR